MRVAGAQSVAAGAVRRPAKVAEFRGDRLRSCRGAPGVPVAVGVEVGTREPATRGLERIGQVEELDVLLGSRGHQTKHQGSRIAFSAGRLAPAENRIVVA